MSHNIRDHAESGLVIFCGAGVSMIPPTCLPSWWQMNEQVALALAGQVEEFIGAKQAADLARQINERRDNQRFPPEYQAEIISKHFGASYFKVLECLDGDEPNAAHLAIASLAKSGHVRAIVTSNFDRLLETAFKKLDVPLEVYYQSDHFEDLAKEYKTSLRMPSTCHLLKLHGSVDDHTTLVDTLAQRMRGLSPAICSCLRHLLRTHHWLFMGYSGADLEAIPQYLCLQSEAASAIGITWLARESSKNEPIEAVIKTLNLYRDRADIPRGELPAWVFDQFSLLLPADLPIPAPLDKEELERRKKEAALTIVDHTREWGETLGSVRAGLILADILEKSVGNPQAAHQLLTKMLAVQVGNDTAYAAVADSLANILSNLGNLDEATELAQTALIRVDPDNEGNRIGILNTLGLIMYKRGEYQRSLDHFEQAYETGSRLSNEDVKSIGLHNRAMVLTSLGLYDQARLCYEEELDIVRKRGDVIAQAQALNNTGDLLRRQNQYEEAIQVLNRSIELRERLGDVSGVAHCLGNIAATHHERGEYSKAKEIYQQIIGIFQSIEDQSGIVTTLCNVGDIAQNMGNSEEAGRVYKQAANIAAEHKMETLRARALSLLGSLYSDTNRFEDAHHLFKEAEIIYHTAKDLAGEAGVLNGMGILFWRDGQLAQAEESLKHAMKIYDNLNQQSGQVTALGNLALVIQDKGDLVQALTLLQEKLSIVNGLQSKDQIANTLYNIGVVQLKRLNRWTPLNACARKWA